MAFKDLFINYTIKSMELTSQLPFKVLVDGIPYSKIKTISIMSPKTMNGFPLAIPILTFLPFK
jgi:hypothetical protein